MFCGLVRQPCSLGSFTAKFCGVCCSTFCGLNTHVPWSVTATFCAVCCSTFCGLNTRVPWSVTATFCAVCCSTFCGLVTVMFSVVCHCCILCGQLQPSCGLSITVLSSTAVVVVALPTFSLTALSTSISSLLISVCAP